MARSSSVAPMAFLLAVTAVFMTACGETAEHKAGVEPSADTPAAPEEAAAAASPDTEISLAGPGQPIRILGIDAAGNGCPQGSVAANISPDAQAFTLLFSSFQLGIEPEGKRQRVILNCDVVLNLDLPKNWQMAVIGIDERGFADLPKGARAKLTTTVHFTEKKNGKVIRSKLHGPYSDDFQVSKPVKLKASQWSKCGGPAGLALDLEAKVVVPKNQTAYLSVDSLDGEMREVVSVAWRQCK